MKLALNYSTHLTLPIFYTLELKARLVAFIFVSGTNYCALLTSRPFKKLVVSRNLEQRLTLRSEKETITATAVFTLFLKSTSQFKE